MLRPPLTPMLAAPVAELPTGPDLAYEPKWDGSPEISRCLRGETSPRSQPDHADPHGLIETTVSCYRQLCDIDAVSASAEKSACLGCADRPVGLR